MRLSLLSLIALSFTTVAANDNNSTFELTEDILKLSFESVKLSHLAYTKNATEYATAFDALGNATAYAHPDYDEIHFYTVEPDEAVVAKKDGRCYLAFRGTTGSLSDWEQNINLESIQIHQDGQENLPSCEARMGYSQFLFSPAVGDAQQRLFQCMDTCSDPSDCLVITGHSQGGAISAIASILLYSFQPTVITFGMPPAVDKDCDLIPSERFYRYVNFRLEENELDDIGFDPVPFSPTFISKSVHYGHYIMVGPDTTAAKYLGFNDDYEFKPTIGDRQNEIEAHTLAGKPFSYEARITGLLFNNTEFPVTTDGFSEGTVCEPQYSELCFTNSCQDFVCSAKVEDICVKSSCRNDEDCVSGFCVKDACAENRDGGVWGGCPCNFNYQCISGDCDHPSFLCEYGPNETVRNETTSEPNRTATNSTSSAVTTIMTTSFIVTMMSAVWSALE